MRYDFATELDNLRFDRRVAILKARRASVDLTEPTQRTKGQNNYLHLLLGVVAMDTGNTLAYVKEKWFKKLVNAPLFVVEVNDPYLGVTEDLRSTKDLTKEEMGMAIDRWKKWGYENGYHMPEAGDESLLKAIEAEMARMKQYL